MCLSVSLFHTLSPWSWSWSLVSCLCVTCHQLGDLHHIVFMFFALMVSISNKAPLIYYSPLNLFDIISMIRDHFDSLAVWTLFPYLVRGVRVACFLKEFVEMSTRPRMISKLGLIHVWSHNFPTIFGGIHNKSPTPRTILCAFLELETLVAHMVALKGRKIVHILCTTFSIISFLMFDLVVEAKFLRVIILPHQWVQWVLQPPCKPTKHS